MSARQTLPAAPTTTIELPDDLADLARAELARGGYPDIAAVLKAGLERLLRDRPSDVARGPQAGTWPPGGGTCGALIRSRDWRPTRLGAVETWSAALRTTMSSLVNSPVAKLLLWGRDDAVMLYNDCYRDIAGRHHPGAIGARVDDVWPELTVFHREVLTRAFAGEVLFFHEHPLLLNRRGVPEAMEFDLYFTPIHETDGRVGGVMCTMLDITERLAAQRAATERGIALQSIADALPYLLVRVDRDHRYRFANAASRDWYGIEPSTLLDRPMRDVIGQTEYLARRPRIDRALQGETVVSRETMPNLLGQRRRLELHYMPSRDTSGGIDGVHILAVDLEDTLHVLEQEHRDNTRFRTAMNAVHGVLWTNAADGRMQGEQPAWAQLTGQSFDAYQGYGWAQAVHPDDAQPTLDAWQAAVAGKRPFVFEHRVRRRDGAWRRFAIRALPILNDGAELLEWVGVHTDITDQRDAEESLRAQAGQLAQQVEHRRWIEEQLRDVNETLEARVQAEIEQRRGAEARLVQSQKMETIGKLTGGVAHDFNNLLQVIAGNLQLLTRDVAGNARGERRVANALAGVTRGARLSAQLLAFGRRQALEPRVVDIGRFVRDLEDMLRRAIGAAIEVTTVFGPGLWNAFIDPAQIESALLNLAVNARDAMNGNGRLTIELANVHLDDEEAHSQDDAQPGDFVMLAISDTGCGIPPEIVDQVFEPFFSTKLQGEGSGLGLSMVYGFVRQSGGHVRIASELERGTTIRLYLPRALADEDRPAACEDLAVPGGRETILVVEDEDGVRAIVVEMLGELGYRVLHAADAASALRIVQDDASIDLLFTDVIMPGSLKSPELARLARERIPGLSVLFTSGYTENTIVHDGRLDAGVALLPKPYTREALARKLRAVLAGRPIAAAVPDTAGPESASPAVAGEGLAVLLVEDDELIRINAAEMLAEAGMQVSEAADAEAALILLAGRMPGVLVTDINLPGMSGLVLAQRARRLAPELGVVVASGDTDPDRTGLPAGAVTLAKPYGRQALLAAVAAAAPAAGLAVGPGAGRA